MLPADEGFGPQEVGSLIALVMETGGAIAFESPASPHFLPGTFQDTKLPTWRKSRGKLFPRS